jgi:hypothetical protein
MTHSAEQAADAIIALINSRPRTPTRDELVAILAKVPSASAAARAAYLQSNWHKAHSVYLEAAGPGSDEELYALRETALAICAQPVRTLDDLAVRLGIQAFWFGDEVSDPDRTCEEQRLIAAIWRGACNLVGLQFDDHGRLL